MSGPGRAFCAQADAGIERNRAFKIDKAKRDLGYAPKVGLDEGLRRTAEWYRAEGLI